MFVYLVPGQTIIPVIGVAEQHLKAWDSLLCRLAYTDLQSPAAMLV